MLRSAIIGSQRVACSLPESHGRCLLRCWLFPSLLTAAGQRCLVSPVRLPLVVDAVRPLALDAAARRWSQHALI